MARDRNPHELATHMAAWSHRAINALVQRQQISLNLAYACTWYNRDSLVQQALLQSITRSCAKSRNMSSDLRVAWEASVPYLVMTLVQLSFAIITILMRSIMVDPSRDISTTVLVFYQLLLASVVLSFIAQLLEREKRPKISFQIICWAFFIAFLQVSLGQLLMTVSLRYITVTIQSVAVNTSPVIVFLLAVATGREKFRVCSLSGQAKLLGILTAAAGAAVVAVFSNPAELSPTDTLTATPDYSQLIGWLMVGLAILAGACASLLVERVAIKYPAFLSLSAMMTISGTLQMGAFSALTGRKPSSWKVDWGRSLQIVCILYGGIINSGIGYCAIIWCYKKKGPTFVSIFSPLLIIFSFLFEALISRRVDHVESVVGIVLVVGGLYLFLWAKSQDYTSRTITVGSQSQYVEDLSRDPLLQNEF